MHVFSSCLLPLALVFDVFISVYVFVCTQTLVDVGDLSVRISRYLSVMVGSL